MTNAVHIFPECEVRHVRRHTNLIIILCLECCTLNDRGVLVIPMMGVKQALLDHRSFYQKRLDIPVSVGVREAADKHPGGVPWGGHWLLRPAEPDPAGAQALCPG